MVKQRERWRLDGWSINRGRVKKNSYTAVKDHVETTGNEVRSTDVEILKRGVTVIRNAYFWRQSIQSEQNIHLY